MFDDPRYKNIFIAVIILIVILVGVYYYFSSTTSGTTASPINNTTTSSAATTAAAPTWGAFPGYGNYPFSNTTLQNQQTDVCLDQWDPQPTDGSSLKISTCLGHSGAGASDLQLMTANVAQNTLVFPSSGMCLDSLKDNVTSGDPVGLNQCTDNFNHRQAFEKQDGGGRGAIRFHNQNGDIYCATIPSTASGTEVVFEPCTYGPEQAWYPNF